MRMLLVSSMARSFRRTGKYNVDLKFVYDQMSKLTYWNGILICLPHFFKRFLPTIVLKALSDLNNTYFTLCYHSQK